MEIKIFYSWQSDLPNNTNRGFIQTSLDRAVKSIRNDESIKVEPRTDKDTQGVGGSPAIPETILQKIDEADIFICDVSIINNKSKFRLTPNPNVLFELGYALKKLSWEKVIMVCNQAYGNINKLPFDLPTRRIIPYTILEKDEDKATERKKLESILESQIRTIIENGNFLPEILEEVKQEKPPSDFILKAQQLAKENEYKKFRNEWFGSQKGVKDIVDSANEIFSQIDENFSSHPETFSQAGIKLITQKFLRSLQTNKLGSQIELKGYDEFNPQYTSTSDLQLQLIVFEKTPLSNDTFVGETISRDFYTPDINEERQVIWKESDNKNKIYTVGGLTNDCFQVLFNQINKKPRLDETVKGGRYIVGGILVNSDGKPIKD